MSAYRAFFGSLGANDYVSAVPALPDFYLGPFEYLSGLDVLKQGSVAFFVSLFYCRYSSELLGKLRESFLVRDLSETVVHVCPLEVLAVGCCGKVGGSIAYAFELLEPELSVFFLVKSSLGEQLCDLLVSFLLCFRSEIIVLVPCLGLARECCPKVLFRLSSCVFIRL